MHRLLICIAADSVLPSEDFFVLFMLARARKMHGEVSVAMVVLCEPRRYLSTIEMMARSRGLNLKIFFEQPAAERWLADQPDRYELNAMFDSE
jgi:hypothetical protein